MPAARRRTKPILTRIMEAYRRAWETRDPDLAASLFTADATYQENPFREPFAGREAIREYWRNATAKHRDVHFTWQSVAGQATLHVVEWGVQFTRLPPGRPFELRGVMLIELRGQLISSFREYWLRREDH